MSGWISVKDRMPNKTGIYPACAVSEQRTYDAENWIEMLYKFDSEAKRGECKWQHGSGFYDNGITHWMDFPESPK